MERGEREGPLLIRERGGGNVEVSVGGVPRLMLLMLVGYGCDVGEGRESCMAGVGVRRIGLEEGRKGTRLVSSLVYSSSERKGGGKDSRL